MKHLILTAAIFLISCGDGGYYVPADTSNIEVTSTDVLDDNNDTDSFTVYSTDSSWNDTGFLDDSDSDTTIHTDNDTSMADTETESTDILDTESETGSSSESEWDSDTGTGTETDTQEDSDSSTETSGTDDGTGTDSETEDTDTGECQVADDCPDLPTPSVEGWSIFRYNCIENTCIPKPFCPEIWGEVNCRSISGCHGGNGEINIDYRCLSGSHICCIL